jgi:hypothetical protein
MSALVLGLLTASATVATSSVTLVVRWAGERPAPAPVVATVDKAVCGERGLSDEALVVDPETGGLAGVVVRVDGTRAPRDAALGALAVRIEGCRFAPHVSVARRGRSLRVRNADRLVHGVWAQRLGRPERSFEVLLPARGQRFEQRLRRLGPHALGSSTHPWMRAWVVVVDDEIAGVTDGTGRVVLTELPPGRHLAVLWHERLGERCVPLDVGPGHARTTTVSWGRPE